MAKSFMRGFTLIEMLVVVTITGLTVGGGIAAYNRFNDRQKVLQAAKTVVNQLRLVQKQADAGEKPDGCGVLDGYAVSAAGQVLVSGALCDGIPDDLLNPTTTTLEGDAFFSNPVGFTFRPLSLGITGASNILVTNSDATTVFTIIVSPGGAIAIQGE
jgi:prepilin-type N-terminal cleavage/methylation domain-containing protein